MKMTLKLGLLATTAAGAVAAGGVTYATVGNSSPAPSAAVKDAKAGRPAVAEHLPPVPSAVPSAPTCLPDVPKGTVLTKVKALAKKAPDAPVTLPATPGAAPRLPTGKLPKVKTPDVAGQAPDATSKLKGTVLKAKDAAKLPLCRQEQKSGTAGTPKLPGKPNLPVPAGVSCDSLPPAIELQHGKVKDFKLPNGAHVTVGHAHSIVIQSQAACAYTQELVTGAGQTITVERLKTPSQVTVQELAQHLKMAGGFVSVSGIGMWRTPLNDGMLFLSKDGYAFRLSGSPATAALLPGIATQLQTQ